MRCRLVEAARKSKTLASLGNTTLEVTQLQAVGEELMLPHETIEYRLVKAKNEAKDTFKSLTLVVPAGVLGEKVHYVMFFNAALSPSEYWFALAHEIGHLALHKGLLHDSHLDRENFFMEEEATFFAQMTFWPLNALFAKFTQDHVAAWCEENIIMFLARVAEQNLNHTVGGHRVSTSRLLTFSTAFWNRFQRYLPESFNRFIGMNSPVIVPQQMPA